MSKKPVFRQLGGFSSAISFAAVLALFAGTAQGALAQGDRGGMPGDFDYYVLALSWSPTYCSGQGSSDGGQYDGQRGQDRGNGSPATIAAVTKPMIAGAMAAAREMAGAAPRSNAAESGPMLSCCTGFGRNTSAKGWPEMCQTGSRPWVPGETIDRMLDIMPSRHLVIQEYKKHGVCSGLDPQGYFDAARKAYGSIRIPEQFQDPQAPLKMAPEDVQRAFLDANRQLSAELIQVVCSRDLLREVRICLSKDLTPRPCSRNEQDRRLCTYSTVTVPPVRGGGTGAHGGPSQYGHGD